MEIRKLLLTPGARDRAGGSPTPEFWQRSVSLMGGSMSRSKDQPKGIGA